MTVNEELRDRALEHQHDVERFRAGLVRDAVLFVSSIMEDVEARVDARLRRISGRGFDPGPATSKRLREMMSSVRDILRGGFGELGDRMVDQARGFGSLEARAQTRILREVTGPLRITIGQPDLRVIPRIVASTPMLGTPMRGWFTDLGDATFRQAEREVRIGVATHETGQQITRRLRGSRASGYTDGVSGVSRRHAATLARTVVTHTQQQVHAQVWDENADLIRGLQWVSTLDGRTSHVCIERDGEVFPLDSGPRPPALPNCRSVMIPALKSAKALGLKDIPEGTRASMDGQVPARESYGDFLRRKERTVGPSFADDKLGKAKAALWRQGKLSLKDLVDQSGRPWTLEQLSERLGIPLETIRAG